MARVPAPGGARPPGAAPAYRLVRPAPSRWAHGAVAPALDPAQREVVEHRGGPLLVLAGPGTGKTTTLVEAVVDRIDGAAPTRSTCSSSPSAGGRPTELRERITARLARTRPGSRWPARSTRTRSACSRARRRARGEPAPRLLSGPEQDLVVRDLLAGDVEPGTAAGPTALRAGARAPAGSRRSCATCCCARLERGVDGRRAAPRSGACTRPRTTGSPPRTSSASTPTSPRCGDAGGAYDPAELIRAAARRARAPTRSCSRRSGPPAPARLRRRVPGHRPGAGRAAPAALRRRPRPGRGRRPRPVDLRASAAPTRRRSGASASGSARPSGTAAPTVVALHLPPVRRRCCSPRTRRVAARLRGLGRGPRGAPGARAGPRVGAGTVEVHVLRTPGEEAAYVAHRLRAAHLLDGVPWREMAVLVRSTERHLPALRRALAAAGVPVAVAGDEVPLVAQPAVRPFLRLLDCALGACGPTRRGARSPGPTRSTRRRRSRCSPRRSAARTRWRCAGCGRSCAGSTWSPAGRAGPAGLLVGLLRDARTTADRVGPDTAAAARAGRGGPRVGGPGGAAGPATSRVRSGPVAAGRRPAGTSRGCRRRWPRWTGWSGRRPATPPGSRRAGWAGCWPPPGRRPARARPPRTCCGRCGRRPGWPRSGSGPAGTAGRPRRDRGP